MSYGQLPDREDAIFSTLALFSQRSSSRAAESNTTSEPTSCHFMVTFHNTINTTHSVGYQCDVAELKHLGTVTPTTIQRFPYLGSFGVVERLH